MSNDEFIAIYDKQGNVVRGAFKKDALDQNLRRGIARIVLFNSNGDTYIQKRSEKKIIAPGLYEQSAAGHIDFGEDPKAAALRELYEELGISVGDLEFVGSYPSQEKKND